MKTFNLEEAKKGNPVITRSGQSARIVCFDRVDKKRGGNILALICNKNKSWERPVYYNNKGTQIDGISDLDLLMQ